MGDGALVEFASAVDAVTCAIEVQKQVQEHNTGSPEDSRIQFRIGINVGDIIVEGDDIYGDGVNLAARIQALADPGGIYISRGAAEQVRDKVPIKIETRGEQTVKNITRRSRYSASLPKTGTRSWWPSINPRLIFRPPWSSTSLPSQSSLSTI